MNIDLLPIPSLILQVDGCILQVNKPAADLLGESPEVLSTRNLTGMLTRYNTKPFLEFLNQIKTRQPEQWVAHLVDKGTIRYITIDVSRLSDFSLLAVLNDITTLEEERLKTLKYIRLLECQSRHNPLATLLVNSNQKIQSVSLAFQEMLDRPSGVVVGQDIRESIRLLAEQVKEVKPFLGILDQVLRDPGRQVNDIVDLNDGRTFYLVTLPLRETKKIIGRGWYFQDISVLKTMEKQIDSQQIFQNAILEHIEDGIVACDAKGELSMFNRASRELHGLSADVQAHDLWFEHYRLFHTDGVTPLQPVDIPLVKALNGIQIKNEEMIIVRADGERRDVQVSGQAMYDTKGVKMGAVVSLHDITDLKRIREQLRELAYYDPLTGMPNRRLFHDLLQQVVLRARRSRERVGVLFLDLDNFKMVNDQLGHDIGDRLLKDLSKILVSCLRESDIICRWGGDEFVIAMPSISGTEDARLIAEKICLAIINAFRKNYSGCRVSTSIGIAMYPDHGKIPDLLIRSADKAMYEAKQKGKNGYCFALPEQDIQDIKDRPALS